mmetsp:Transcript_4602/g.10150  ORF Transcript_4602/g.10150 Transcript_4602/m.10150 type:complete len:201 (-) Transcript_4602:518-1120(-)
MMVSTSISWTWSSSNTPSPEISPLSTPSKPPFFETSTSTSTSASTSSSSTFQVPFPFPPSPFPSSSHSRTTFRIHALLALNPRSALTVSSSKRDSPRSCLSNISSRYLLARSCNMVACQTARPVSVAESSSRPCATNRRKRALISAKRSSRRRRFPSPRPAIAGAPSCGPRFRYRAFHRKREDLDTSYLRVMERMVGRGP